MSSLKGDFGHSFGEDAEVHDYGELSPVVTRACDTNESTLQAMRDTSCHSCRSCRKVQKVVTTHSEDRELSQEMQKFFSCDNCDNSCLASLYKPGEGLFFACDNS